MTSTVLSVVDAAEHVGATVSAVNQAIYAGYLTTRKIPHTGSGVRGGMLKGVEKNELEEWAQTSPRLRNRHLWHDYRFFVDFCGMSDARARRRIEDGYGLSEVTVWGSVRNMAKQQQRKTA